MNDNTLISLNLPANSTEGSQLVGTLCRFPALMSDLGADIESVCRAAGLTPEDIADPAQSIPFSAFGKLLRAGVDATGRDDIGLQIGMRAELGFLGPVGDLMQNAPTVRQALFDLMRLQSRYIRGAAVYALMDGPDMILGYSVYQPGVDGLELIADAVVAAGVAYVAMLSGTSSGVEVLLARRRPAAAHAWAHLLSVPVQFDTAHSGMFVPVRLLDAPVRRADPVLRRQLETSVRSYIRVQWPTLAERLQREIRVRLMTGQAVSREDLADAFSVSVRTLNRTLNGEGHSFQSILTAARFELARQLLLGTDMDIGEITLAIGFSQHSVFSRAFRLWTGKSPVEWREELRAASS